MADSNLMIAQFGVVTGLQMMAMSREMTQDNANGLLAGYLGNVMLVVTTEADSEIKKLTAANERIKTLARGIKANARMSFTDGRIGEMRQAARAFDGWTVSLLETDYKILGMLEGTMNGFSRTSTLVNGLTSLMSERIKSGSLFAEAKTKMVY